MVVESMCLSLVSSRPAAAAVAGNRGKRRADAKGGATKFNSTIRG